MRSLYTAFGLLFLSAVGGASAQSAPEPRPIRVTQFVFPHGFMELPVESRRWYVAGVIDREREATPQVFEFIRACVDRYPLDHLTAIVEKGLASSDPRMGTTMPLIVHNALLLNCSQP